ncbi:hypothetical protein NX059_010195 [Plenodomus lindquistii]|nr:hypothetical protein NX059_010195 [Plenodomus lindquistii]
MSPETAGPREALRSVGGTSSAVARPPRQPVTYSSKGLTSSTRSSWRETAVTDMYEDLTVDNTIRSFATSSARSTLCDGDEDDEDEPVVDPETRRSFPRKNRSRGSASSRPVYTGNLVLPGDEYPTEAERRAVGLDIMSEASASRTPTTLSSFASPRTTLVTKKSSDYGSPFSLSEANRPQDPLKTSASEVPMRSIHLVRSVFKCQWEMEIYIFAFVALTQVVLQPDGTVIKAEKETEMVTVNGLVQFVLGPRYGLYHSDFQTLRTDPFSYITC